MVSGNRDGLTWVTGRIGQPLLDADDMDEPERGSILMTGGAHGTAWQRHFRTGLWHSTRGGAPKTWEFLTRKRNVVLVYDADPRPDPIPKQEEEA